MSSHVRSQLAHLKRRIRPAAFRWLARIPVTPHLVGLGHILMFHRVVPPEQMSHYGMRAFEITPQQLEMIINFFVTRGYRIVSLDELCDSLTRNSISDRIIALTFDDGYKDTLTYAYPILKTHNAPFTVNITYNYAERAGVKWDYLAEEIVKSNTVVIVDSPRGRLCLDCSTPECKRRSCNQLQNILYEMNDSESCDRVKSFFSSYRTNIFDKTDELMLDWPQIQELANDSLVTIGAHSISHHVLSRLNETSLGAEIALSKTHLESRLGVEVSHFAYPYGRIHEAGAREYETVRRCGFRTGTTGMIGNIFNQHAGRLHSLPRFCLGSNLSEDHLASIANGTLPLLANRFKRMPTTAKTQLDQQ